MLEVKKVTKKYQDTILDAVSFSLPKTGLFAIVGDSGCGKTTLLNILGGLDLEYQGKVLFGQRDIRDWKQYNQNIGFLFQNFHIIEWLRVHQNIVLPKYFRHIHEKNFFVQQLQRMHLTKLKNKRMIELSGGQKQRVALLRAIASPIKMLLCDEPTGSLDDKNAREVFAILKEESKKRLVIVVSHDIQLVKEYADEILYMKDGRIENECDFAKEHTFCLEEEEVGWCRALPLMFLQTVSKWKRNIKICSGVSLAILCILLTFTLRDGLQSQIQEQLQKVLPNTSISMAVKNGKSVSVESLHSLMEEAFFKHSYVDVNGYEFMGISKENQYHDEKVLYIGDTTKSLDEHNIVVGRMPNQIQEIAITKSTAIKLYKDKWQEVVGKSIYGWYLHESGLQHIELTVVGISDERTILDTIYMRPLANTQWIANIYPGQSLTTSLAILEVYPTYESDSVLKTLQDRYPDYHFKISGKEIEKHIDSILDQVRLVLYCFSVLAIISSCFLIGEVLFLSNVERMKEIGIFKCFGANKYTIQSMTIVEAIILVSIAYGMAVYTVRYLLQVVNQFVEKQLQIVVENGFIQMDIKLFVIVYGMTVIFAVLSSVLPSLYAAKVDVIKALKS